MVELVALQPAPAHPLRVGQVGPQLFERADQVVDPLGRLPEPSGVGGRLGGDPGVVFLDLGQASVVEFGLRLAHPEGEGLGLMLGGSAELDGHQGDPDDELAGQLAVRLHLGFEGLEQAVKFLGVLGGQDDAFAGQAVLEAIGAGFRFSSERGRLL
jgi:hypothetical protein